MSSEQIQELLKPRYKVIVDYPSLGSYAKIGDVLHGEYVFTGKKNYPMEDYPSIFQKLPWWAEREESELPKYVKLIHLKLITDKVYPEFMEVDEWRKYETRVSAVIGEYLLGAEYIQPATEQEYNDYMKKKTPV